MRPCCAAERLTRCFRDHRRVLCGTLAGIGGTQPDVRIEPDLVAGMTGEHRPAARLAQVTDIDAVPPRLAGRYAAEILNEIYCFGMSPVAVARQPHGLPRRAGFGQFHSARDAALGIASERIGSGAGAGGLCAEKLLCGFEAVLMARCAQRRQRCRLPVRHGIGRLRATHQHNAESEGGQDQRRSHSKSPFGLTHSSKTSPRMNSPAIERMPRRWLPVTSETTAISAGAMKEVALPDRA